MASGCGMHLCGCSNATKTRPVVEAAKFCSNVRSSKNPEITLPCRDQNISQCEHAQTYAVLTPKNILGCPHLRIEGLNMFEPFCAKSEVERLWWHKLLVDSEKICQFPRQGRWWSLFRPCGRQDFEKPIPAQRLGWSWPICGLLIDVGDVGMAVDLKVDRDYQYQEIDTAGICWDAKMTASSQ